MILLLLILLVADLLTLGFFIGGYFLFNEWLTYKDTLDDIYARQCLYGAIAVLIWLAFGRYLTGILLSRRRPAEESPGYMEGFHEDVLDRPDGSRIHVQYAGNPAGHTIIFVHGLGATMDEWYYQRKYFGIDHRLVFFDLAGMGRSKGPANRDHSLEKMAADLQAVIDHAGEPNPVLWGHSLGGMVILTLLARNKGNEKDAPSAVILQHTTYTNPVKTMAGSRMMTAIQRPLLRPFCYLMIGLWPLVWMFRWLSYFNGHAHIIFRILGFTGTQTPGQLDFVTRLFTASAPWVMGRTLLRMFRYEVTGDLPQLAVPALVVAGDQDRLTVPEAGHFLHGYLPKAQLLLLSPAGHMGMMERHVEVNEGVAAFLHRLWNRG